MDDGTSIALAEYNRIVHEIYTKMESRQSLLRLEIVIFAAVSGSLSAFLLEGGFSIFSKYLKYFLPVLGVVFSAFFVQIAHNQLYVFLGGAYIHQVLRKRLRDGGQHDMLEWEHFLAVKRKEYFRFVNKLHDADYYLTLFGLIGTIIGHLCFIGYDAYNARSLGELAIPIAYSLSFVVIIAVTVGTFLSILNNRRIVKDMVASEEKRAMKEFLKT